jgi:hypothetical protein
VPADALQTLYFHEPGSFRPLAIARGRRDAGDTPLYTWHHAGKRDRPAAMHHALAIEGATATTAAFRQKAENIAFFGLVREDSSFNCFSAFFTSDKRPNSLFGKIFRASQAAS